MIKLMKLITKRLIAFVLAISTTASMMGCEARSETNVSDDTHITSDPNMTIVPNETTMYTEGANVPTIDATTLPTDNLEIDASIPSTTESPTEAPTQLVPVTSTPTEAITVPTTIPEPETDEYGLTDKQRNSFSMLYYLAITAERIRVSKDNRLLLDEIYTSLLNDINPGSIDETTQDHLRNMRDVLKKYISISTKRDRLQFIYNQNKAAAIRNAVPNPLAVLSITNALDWKKLAVSVAYTVADSVRNYKNASTAADQEFLMSGWELDDEETDTIQKNRERAFDYMVDIVQEYGLNGKLTLNEKAIETFAQICSIESVHQKIHRLESEYETYKLLGNYWLELADSYFETGKYRDCLRCIQTYESLSTGIHRHDHDYAQMLPKAIVAAQRSYVGHTYTYNIAQFADAIVSNTTTDEWSLRYFAAQTYLDLYAKTNKTKYLEAAYKIAYDNVAILLDTQRELNEVYLNEVKEIEVTEPDYSFMSDTEKEKATAEYEAEQDRLKIYNRELHEKRETELPPLYEPFILNCELLFALANRKNITNSVKEDIDNLLHENGDVFLSKPIRDRYSFFPVKEEYNIELQKDKLRIPADLLSSEAKVVVTVSDKGYSQVFNDCTITNVEREGETIDSFYAVINSEKMDDYQWSEDSKVSVQITNIDQNDSIVLNFKVLEYKKHFIDWLISDEVVFEKI